MVVDEARLNITGDLASLAVSRTNDRLVVGR
jgi:hypothetical protein